MNSRPHALSVVSWIIIVYSIFGLLACALVLGVKNMPEVQTAVAAGGVSLDARMAVACFTIGVQLVCAVLFLRRQGWARYLYVVCNVAALAFSFWSSPFAGWLVLPGALVPLVIVIIVFRPAVNRWFAGQNENHPQRSVFIDVVAWFFVMFSAVALVESLLLAFVPLDKLLAAAKLPQQSAQPVPQPEAVAGIMHGFALFMIAVMTWVVLSAIGVIRRKGWARISFIVVLSLGIFFSMIYVLIGALTAAISPGGDLPGQPPGSAAMVKNIMSYMALFGAVLVAVYGFIIYKLSTAGIKAEFESQPPPPNA